MKFSNWPSALIEGKKRKNIGQTYTFEGQTEEFWPNGAGHILQK
jgi:hypothetical protein